jgi:hypothetical protein
VSALVVLQAWVLEMAKALARWLWFGLVMVLVLAESLRSTLKDYLRAKYRKCKWCKAGQNHPHKRIAECHPYHQKMNLNYPNQSETPAEHLLDLRI